MILGKTKFQDVRLLPYSYDTTSHYLMLTTEPIYTPRTGAWINFYWRQTDQIFSTKFKILD